MSSLDVKRSEFVQIHQKPVRDACFSCQGDGLLLTAAMDKTIKITSMLSNTVVQRYTALWMISLVVIELYVVHYKDCQDY